MPANDSTTRGLLEGERDELLQRIDELTAGGQVDLDFDDDFADRGQVASEQGENRVLADTLASQLTLVEHALRRLDGGTYGTCEVCGAEIGSARLDAMPAASRCIAHADASGGGTGIR